jgi:hypothetical protein
MKQSRIMTEIGCLYALFGEPINPEDVARNLDLSLALVEDEFSRLESVGQIKWGNHEHMLDGYIPTT